MKYFKTSFKIFISKNNLNHQYHNKLTISFEKEIFLPKWPSR